MELQTQTLLPSPSSSTSSSNNTTTTTTNINNNDSFPAPPKQVVQPPLTRSESNPYPTTFVQADTSSFKQVVQMLTGSTTPKQTNPNPIPPMKTPNKSKTSSKLYERRSTTLKNLRLTAPTLSPRHEILSPSLLDFPSLVLSPVTPLIHDPFIRSPISSNSSPCPTLVLDQIAEDKAIADKGFFLHPSPVSTPRDSEPRLLPLFPLSSPRNLSSTGSNNHHLTS